MKNFGAYLLTGALLLGSAVPGLAQHRGDYDDHRNDGYYNRDPYYRHGADRDGYYHVYNRGRYDDRYNEGRYDEGIGPGKGAAIGAAGGAVLGGLLGHSAKAAIIGGAVGAAGGALGGKIAQDNRNNDGYGRYGYHGRR